ncbi:MAG: alanine--tRNA ligase [Bacteroidota bacterium]|jgi:alanyl-tRNA synthetase|nr:alanine--tRNA ligase [Bacteroidota bacterium]
MESNKVRQTFLDFFKSKGHEIVPSAPMVVKGDPTLMFINSGMAPFKDIFLGNAPIKFPRVADTQKCLRVSGKHNDLEEVGVDTYHHTMFEMLGNWSFGDYFKKEAIAWAWELLTEVYKIDKSRLYVTVFEGSAEENVPFDQEAYDTWKLYIEEKRILKGNKKDNFWEMGDTGPCGPCTEIHYDGRSDEERAKIDGATLVNNDDPRVIEVWNNVFMEFMRKADKSLEKLPAQHVDTGMGFERLVRVLQNKQSNYDTDVFTPLLNKIEELSGLRYKPEDEEDHKKQQIINIAMRVIADHIRTISFSIADGQLPSNTGAGYVIRRILRRAIRYGYQSLNIKEPFMYRIVPTLAHQLGQQFPELTTQKMLIEKVIKEEEISFYKTLEIGLKRIDQVCIDLTNSNSGKVIDGKVVFELYDTFGFPLDLTSLIARGYDLSIDEEEFNRLLTEQKNRSRAATTVDTDDWITIEKNKKSSDNSFAETEFVGYSELECEAHIIRYRKVKAKNKEQFQVVLNRTPFYAESGGQVGDSGTLSNINETILINDTKKENGVIIHFCDKLPENMETAFTAKVNLNKRRFTENNHSATHLLHAALRQVLGTHVEQKGSLVNEEYLRFDFSHFSKITDEELNQIEKIVNTKIRENIASKIQQMTIDDAKKTGAMALFGEKYGDVVRVVEFDKNYSIELCGGTHVKATGQIGYFKITSESAVAAGIRRIEAVTAVKAEEFFNDQISTLNEVKALLKNNKDVIKSLSNLVEENNDLHKQLQSLLKEKAQIIKQQLLSKVQNKNGINFIAEKISFDSAEEIKNILFEIRNQLENCVCVIGAEVKGKPSISVIIDDNLVKEKNLNAGNIIRDLAKEINGGGGGQPFYAQAGGSKLEGLNTAMEKAKSLF